MTAHERGSTASAENAGVALQLVVDQIKAMVHTVRRYDGSDIAGVLAELLARNLNTLSSEDAVLLAGCAAHLVLNSVEANRGTSAAVKH